MEENKLAALIPPLETFAETNPGTYRLRVGLLATLGYVYLLLVVSLLLAIVVLAVSYMGVNWVAIKILWIPLALVGLVLRSLWITIPEPEGMELKREQAPALFDLIDEVQQALSGPKIHRVLLSEEFNAGIVQIPQFGMFGWLRNYLVVGLPLLRALNPAEFRAVLAHEVGHLSGKHGRFSGWIYRLRQSWSEILTRVHYERRYASFLFEPFVNWYAPYLNAYSFVLARAQERQADQYSVELAGREVAAIALIRLEAKQRSLMETFWPNFFRQSKDQAKTPTDPFVQMLGGLAQPIGSTNTQKWLFDALRIPTGYEDTHPALSDRLAAIGFEKDGQEVTALIDSLLVADENKQSAESYYLRELPQDFLPWLNRLWRERIAQTWSENHEQIKKVRKRLVELDEQASARALTLEEQWERVKILGEVEDNNATLPSLKALLAEHPEHVGAHFAMGAILLEQQNAEGVEHLEKAMQLNPATTGDASVLLSSFYFDQGNKELSEVFRKRAAEHFEEQRKQQERAMTFAASDRFLPHGLDEPALKELQQQLNKVYGLSDAYLVRKVVGADDASIYVLAAVASFTWKDGRSEKHVDSLFEQLMALPGLPSPIVFVSLDGAHGYLQPNLAQIEGAQLFTRSDAGVEYRH
jgi:Zn-dependent protease with chaperone function